MNFQFTTNSPCFLRDETETGLFTLQGNFNGQVNGTLGLIVRSETPSDTLTLTGNAAGKTISGNWTLTGSTGSGRFTMRKM